MVYNTRGGSKIFMAKINFRLLSDAPPLSWTALHREVTRRLGTSEYAGASQSCWFEVLDEHGYPVSNSWRGCAVFIPRLERGGAQLGGPDVMWLEAKSLEDLVTKAAEGGHDE